MNNIKYVALDAHDATIVAEVQNSFGKSLMKSIIETNPNSIRDFVSSISGTVHLTFEEGTHADWLYDLIHPLVAEIVVCNPRHNKLLQSGNKADRIDTSKLIELYRNGSLRPVFHGAPRLRTLKQLVHCYDSLVEDSTRVKNRIKAIYRGRGIACSGDDIYKPIQRQPWLDLLLEPGLRARAETLFQELDSLRPLIAHAEKRMLAEAQRLPAYKIVKSVPALGPIRVAQIISVVGSPFRFRTKRQFWTYCGLAVVTRSSSDYHFIDGKSQRRKQPPATRGLNQNHNRRLKHVFKSASVDLIRKEGLFKEYYQAMIRNKVRPEMAVLQVARKLAAITLAVWKSQQEYDEKRLIKQTD